MGNDEKLPKEIINAEKFVSEMRKALNRFSRSEGGNPTYSITPYQLTLNRTEEEEEIDKTIGSYTYRSLVIMLRIAEFHLEEAKKAGKLIDMKNNCETVYTLYLAFLTVSNFSDTDGPIELRQYQSSSQPDGSGTIHKFEGRIDCNQEPYNKMLSTLRLSQPMYKSKRIGLFISTERRMRKISENSNSKEIPPRLNIQIPINDSVMTTNDSDNIVTIRWDFDSIGIDSTRPNLDLTWIGQREDTDYANLSVGQFAGHHFPLDENISLSEAKKILERINKYLTFRRR